MKPQEVQELIKRRRNQLLVHRCLYYVYNVNLIEDSTYDKWNRELITLEQQYPDIARLVEFHENSPSKTVGSCDIKGYPEKIVEKAEYLMMIHGIKEE